MVEDRGLPAHVRVARETGRSFIPRQAQVVALAAGLFIIEHFRVFVVIENNRVEIAVSVDREFRARFVRAHRGDYRRWKRASLFLGICIDNTCRQRNQDYRQ